MLSFSTDVRRATRSATLTSVGVAALQNGRPFVAGKEHVRGAVEVAAAAMLTGQLLAEWVVFCWRTRYRGADETLT